MELAAGRRVHALIVDHALRPESAAEAERAAAIARDLGATAHVLRWTAPRKSQARSRQARHQLLADQARALGARRVFLAHTLDDQRETAWMREQRDAGARGLAAMGRLAPSPVWPEGRGLMIARPFLDVSRAALRAALIARGADWIEDASNADRAYERVRVRAALSDLNAADLAALDRRIVKAQAEEISLRCEAAALSAACAAPRPWGGFSLDRAAMLSAPRPAVLRALEAIAAAAAGRPDAPSSHAAGVLLDALIGGEAATAGGAMLTCKGVIGRDPGAAGRADGAGEAAPLALSPGETGVFDGRFEVSADAEPITVRALGKPAPALDGAPAALRAGLAAIMNAHGARLSVAGLQPSSAGRAVWLGENALTRQHYHAAPSAWFDEGWT